MIELGKRFDLAPCDTLLLVRAASILIADTQFLCFEAAVARGTAHFSRLVSQALRSRSAELRAQATARCSDACLDYLGAGDGGPAL